MPSPKAPSKEPKSKSTELAPKTNYDSTIKSMIKNVTQHCVGDAEKLDALEVGQVSKKVLVDYHETVASYFDLANTQVERLNGGRS